MYPKNYFLAIVTLISYVVISSCSKETTSTSDTIVSNTGEYYYSMHDTIFLKTIPGEYIVEFNHPVDEQQMILHNMAFKKITDNYYIIYSNLSKIHIVFGNEIIVNPVYQTVEGGNDRIILNEIILKYKEQIEYSAKIELIDDYNLQLTDSTRLYCNYRVINPLQISREIFESGLVDYCHPVFIGTPPTPW
jgi:hypothetical protein